MSEAKPLLAITMGDPAGVGPELCLNLLNQRSILSQCIPIIFGDYECLKRVSAELNQPFDAKVISINESFRSGYVFCTRWVSFWIFLILIMKRLFLVR